MEQLNEDTKQDELPKPNNEAVAKPQLKPQEEPLTQTTEKQTENQGPEKKLLVPK